MKRIVRPVSMVALCALALLAPGAVAPCDGAVSDRFMVGVGMSAALLSRAVVPSDDPTSDEVGKVASSGQTQSRPVRKGSNDSGTVFTSCCGSSQGPYLCSSGADEGGLHEWANPNYVTSTMPVGYASVGLGPDYEGSNTLQVTFNSMTFSVPGTATVTGIVISMKTRDNQDGGWQGTAWLNIGSGTTKTFYSTPAKTWVTTTLGGSGDLWGTSSITPASVNGAWTVSIIITSDSMYGSFFIQDVTATVYYE